MESNETVMHVTTRPSSPIIEDLRSIPNGLNISWKSDVNSRQDKYEVWYKRNDTNHIEKVYIFSYLFFSFLLYLVITLLI